MWLHPGMRVSSVHGLYTEQCFTFFRCRIVLRLSVFMISFEESHSQAQLTISTDFKAQLGGDVDMYISYRMSLVLNVHCFIIILAQGTEDLVLG